MFNRISILFNPSSAKGKAGRSQFILQKMLWRHGIDAEFHFSHSAEHLAELAQHVSGDRLAVAGGDSSFTLVANVLRQNPSAPALALLPMGSCNDIARAFAMDDLDQACAVLAGGRVQAVDLGEIRSGDQVIGHFWGQVSLGLGAVVNREIETWLNQRPWLAGVRGLLGVQAARRALNRGEIPLELSVHAGMEIWQGKTSMVVCSHIPHYAGGLSLLPQADPCDGQLDLFWLDPCSLPGMIGHFRALRRLGGNAPLTGVHRARAAIIDFQASQPFVLQADGEILGAFQTVTLSTLAGALRLVVPSG